MVDIATDGRHLSVHRGFLVVEERGDEVGRVPLDDVEAVIASARALTFSANLLQALAERGVGLVVCGTNHQPVSVLMPVVGHHAQAGRVRDQIEAGKPLTKRLWQGLVRAKVENQGAVLARMGVPHGAFAALARAVRSGDPDNVEAQAARRYWPLLMGADFRRDTDAGGANALLNYGYAVLRGAVARAVLAAGLHPSIGVHHANRGNPLCLVDDVMEPFRPLVDALVVDLVRQGVDQVTPEAKRQLAALLLMDMATSRGTTPLATCIVRLATSLALAFETGQPDLELPLTPLPLDLVSANSGQNQGATEGPDDGFEWIQDHVDDGAV
ncbi:type II CRISPR-associated endonuclease Cas1 [Nitrospirillum sp. BR 11163]|uniref:type II CRISPR-associated endonuclease Cas1 n=1 Tax=Nitrospirillum sp. BR 11163 TaxID=3104323 RepID=UPI002AFE8045|nr:type II CRISPR-associated endonuclease Cas1 [Nitrospirillum sp. BR 11163]MEA1674364.1 type II CRISPR-associated endonuclease Cas1 [Nitrospirillum sp. BR 11163]